jgi:heme/copper-type cytochrome/quinol oxidase subunit 2
MTLRSFRPCRSGIGLGTGSQRTRASLLAASSILVLTMLLQPGPALAQNPVFSLSIRDDQFVPSELEVPAGQKIELHVTNQRASASEFESADLRREKIVPAGEQVTVYVGPLRPGTYEFFDDFNPKNRGHLVAR